MECDNQLQQSQRDGDSKEIAAETRSSHQNLNDSSDRGPAEKKMKPSDFAEFDGLIDELANELKLARHPDSSIVLKAARLLLEASSNQKVNSQQSDSPVVHTEANVAIKASTSIPGNYSNRTIQQSKFSLDDVPLPKTFITKSDSETNANEDVKLNLSFALEKASKALKLLYLDDQRQLQNRVNQLITSVQSITANPKTNSRLMATGR